MTEPRELTDDEVREQFLRHVWTMIGYWASEPWSNVPEGYSNRQRLEGLAHSILTTIDGSSAGIPAFALAPSPHPEDKEFHRSEGENWWPTAGRSVPHDIGGGLHEHFYNFDPKRAKP